MTVTKNETKDETDGQSDAEARRLRRELFSDELVDQPLASAGERGVALTGKGGFLPEMIKAVLERGDGRGADLAPGVRARRTGRARDGELPQWHDAQDDRLDEVLAALPELDVDALLKEVDRRS